MYILKALRVHIVCTKPEMLSLSKTKGKLATAIEIFVVVGSEVFINLFIGFLLSKDIGCSWAVNEQHMRFMFHWKTFESIK